MSSMAAALCITYTTKLRHSLHRQTRTFIDARVKWVRDPYLDHAVSREKNLKPLLSLKNQLISSASLSLPLTSLSPLKPHIGLPSSASDFIQKYPSVFTLFQPSPSLPLHVKLTPRAVTLHREEESIQVSPEHRRDAVMRLFKLLMLAGGAEILPLHVINRFRFDIGLPHNYITSILSDYPDYFEIGEVQDRLTRENTLGLGILSWKHDFAVSEMEKREGKGMPIRFSMNFPNGFDLEKRMKRWVDEWQELPYISPYENAFHLNPKGDQAEKWTVAVLHELMWLLVSKKTEKENLFCLGEYLGFDNDRIKKALRHHPGIFYVSNKIRMQTVVLREAYRKDFLVEKHPLMGMRHRYLYLMDQRRPVGDERKRKTVRS